MIMTIRPWWICYVASASPGPVLSPPGGWTRMCWAGLGWAGLGWAGLGWAVCCLGKYFPLLAYFDCFNMEIEYCEDNAANTPRISMSDHYPTVANCMWVCCPLISGYIHCIVGCRLVSRQVTVNGTKEFIFLVHPPSQPQYKQFIGASYFDFEAHSDNLPYNITFYYGEV